MSWPPTSPTYAGECWAIEAELTPKPVPRTAGIMSGLLTLTDQDQPSRPPRYDRVIYLCAAPARPVAERAAAALPSRLTARLVVRDLPDGAVLA